MATYNWPASIRPATVKWQLVFNSQGFTSPLSGVEQTAELQGAKWMATLTFNSLKRHEIAELEAFIFKCRGKANRVYLWDHFRETPRGLATGVARVKGANQVGNSINTDGWTANQVGALLAADRITINGEFKAVLDTVNSDATGNAVITFEPPLRKSLANNAVITTLNAPAKMMLIDDGQGQLGTARSLTSTTLSFIEDIS